jgi:hypothetical protein
MGRKQVQNLFENTIAFYETIDIHFFPLYVTPEVQKQGENEVNDYVFDCQE